jgi:lipopolysaccharide transport system permease protein
MTAFTRNAPEPFLKIRPQTSLAGVDLREMWQFRDLLLALAERDVKLRYKQTALGVIWVVLQPLLGAGIFTFVFGRVAKFDSDGVPYFIFSYAGLLGWNAFNSTRSTQDRPPSFSSGWAAASVGAQKSAGPDPA